MPRDLVPTSGEFGAAVYDARTRVGLSQGALASAAALSAGYLSELENCKRLAPPRATALRIAKALGLAAEEAARLVEVAGSERAARLHESHLPPRVRDLIAAIRVAAPLLPAEFVDLLRAKVEEATMS